MSLDLHGLLLMDKPAGMTSHDVVAKVRRCLKQKRVGHTGTLDPIATGLMVMVLGEATKISDYLMGQDKSYIAEIRLGVRTDTMDRTGQVIETKAVNVSDDVLAAAVKGLEGRFEWPVPVFSAVKVDGRPLHEMARRQMEIEPPVKTMSFWDVRLLERNGDLVRVGLSCSKGGFIRTWADQLGQTLGTGAMVSELRRTRVGPWTVERGVTLIGLEQDGGKFQGAFVNMADALPAFRSLVLDPREARLMNNGQIASSLAGRLIPEQKQAFDSGSAVFVKASLASGQLLALLAAEPGQGLKIRRVFRLAGDS